MRFFSIISTPIAYASDVIDAGDEGVILGEDGGTRPGGCPCHAPEQDLPCWPCYRDGFDTPNPSAGEE